MNMMCAFVNGYLQKALYINQSLGFDNTNQCDHDFKLNRALYGLKQAPNHFYFYFAIE